MTGTLDQLPLGRSAHVSALHLTGKMRQRMQDLGFIPGICVTAVHISPLGDPVAYRVLDTVIALRKDDASKIEIA